VEAYKTLKSQGVQARVVSMPSWELFEQQDEAYKTSVFPPNVKARVSVEMAATLGWERYVGANGAVIGMHRFGASAPWKDLQKKFGFTADAVVEAAKRAIAKSK
jgi:transketolase